MTTFDGLDYPHRAVAQNYNAATVILISGNDQITV